ncbi:patatin-like phospholipase family protein [Zhouia sp. PK063]|uniref:patatin-like phospholipase family protein n=1 Tax=Zhouia sp. PK063 TaxID=3373602 RepID=UPI0037B4E88E
MERQKIGLVLSGGGVKALAHAGLIKALLEFDINPEVLSGTSGGAIVAALYASNYHPDEMVRFFKETPIFKLNLFAMHKPGIIDSEKYQDIFKRFFINETFESLKYPLTITATNINQGTLRYFDSGDLIKPLIASSALPPYFSPIEIEGELFSDGGILNNFPTEPVKHHCDVLIGSFVSPVKPIEHSEVNTTLKLIQRIFHIGLDANYASKFGMCDYLFLPQNIEHVGMLETKMIDSAYELGYENACVEIEKTLKKTLEFKNEPVPPLVINNDK